MQYADVKKGDNIYHRDNPLAVYIISDISDSFIAVRNINCKKDIRVLTRADLREYRLIKNMVFPPKDIVDAVRQEYPDGTRVKCLYINDDFCTIPSGELGTVLYVDDTGTIFVSWDNSGMLGVVFGEDRCEKMAG